MKIWVDADAAPGDVKRILFKAAERAQVPLTLVANVPLRHPDSRYITSKVVEDGFNIADDWIAEQCEPGDLVITADIPLADRVIERGATAIDPRGTVYTENNIKGKLATRDLLDDLRGASLVEGGGPPPYTKKDVHKFASAFQTLLAVEDSERALGASLLFHFTPSLEAPRIKYFSDLLSGGRTAP